MKRAPTFRTAERVPTNAIDRVKLMNSPCAQDTIEFFDLVLETRLTAAEKADLLAFLQTL